MQNAGREVSPAGSDDAISRAADEIEGLHWLVEAEWSDEGVKRRALSSVASALQGWSSWSAARRLRWAELLIEETIRQILPITLRADQSRRDFEGVATMCEREGTAEAADRAVERILKANAYGRPVYTAAIAAHSTAKQVGTRPAFAGLGAAHVALITARMIGESDQLLALACSLWVDAATKSADAD